MRNAKLSRKTIPRLNSSIRGRVAIARTSPIFRFVVRFKAPTTGSVTYVDKVFGEIVTPNVENQDFVLIRKDGIPLYNFGAVVDDMTMGITLVARGRDHMINTPPQILLYEAFEAKVPEFAHLPMMLAPSGEKLSKAPRCGQRLRIPRYRIYAHRRPQLSGTFWLVPRRPRSVFPRRAHCRFRLGSLRSW